MLYLYFVPFIGFQIKYDDDDDWQLHRSTRNWSHAASNSPFECSGSAITANDSNTYFADIATDPYYSPDLLYDNFLPSSKSHDKKTRTNIKNPAQSNLHIVP